MSSVPASQSSSGASSSDAMLFNSIFNAFAGAMSGSKGGSAPMQPLLPNKANPITGTNLSFDNSGWNTSFGAGSVFSSAPKTTTQGAGPASPSGAASSQTDSYLIVGVVLFVLVIAMKPRKRR